MNITLNQKTIIDQIKTLNDSSVLILNNQQGKYQLTDSQKESVKISREQIRSGEFSNQKEYFTDLRSWLKEK